MTGLTGVVVRKAFLRQSKLVLGDISARFEISHWHLPARQLENLPALGEGTDWTHQVIGKSGLTNLVVEAEEVRDATNNIEADEAAGAVKRSDGLCGYISRKNTDVQLALYRNIGGKQIGSKSLREFWVVTKLVLLLRSIYRYWHSWGCGKHLSVGLNVLGYRLADIPNRQIENQSWLISLLPAIREPLSCGLNRKPRALRDYRLSLYSSRRLESGGSLVVAGGNLILQSFQLLFRSLAALSGLLGSQRDGSLGRFGLSGSFSNKLVRLLQGFGQFHRLSLSRLSEIMGIRAAFLQFAQGFLGSVSRLSDFRYFVANGLPLTPSIAGVYGRRDGHNYSCRSHPELSIGYYFDPEPNRGPLEKAKGWFYISIGGVFFLMGMGMLRAGADLMLKKWYFGISAVVLGLTFMYIFVRLVIHGAGLVGGA